MTKEHLIDQVCIKGGCSGYGLNKDREKMKKHLEKN